MNTTNPQDFQTIARKRIDSMNFTDAELEFIWADWPNWSEHIEWLATAPEAEIRNWIDKNAD